MLAKIGPVHEAERAPAGGEVFLDDLGAGDVARHEVGRELHPGEAELERLRHRLDHERLGEAGHADQEGVAPGQHRGEDPVHHVFLAHDALRHLGPEALHGADEALELLDVVLGNALGRGHAALGPVVG